MHIETGAEETTSGISEARRANARRLVARSQDALHRAAREGILSDKAGFAILSDADHLGPNAALPAAAALIYYARAAAVAAARAAQRPQQDCVNTWGEPGLLSCEQQRLIELESECAVELAVQLTDGPWPIC
jgi:hypothetical protein